MASLSENMSGAVPNKNEKKWLITFAHCRDDEQALLLLLQCGYSVEEALRRKRMNAGATELRKRPPKILFFIQSGF